MYSPAARSRTAAGNFWNSGRAARDACRAARLTGDPPDRGRAAGLPFALRARNIKRKDQNQALDLARFRSRNAGNNRLEQAERWPKFPSEQGILTGNSRRRTTGPTIEFAATPTIGTTYLQDAIAARSVIWVRDLFQSRALLKIRPGRVDAVGVTLVSFARHSTVRGVHRDVTGLIASSCAAMSKLAACPRRRTS